MKLSLFGATGRTGKHILEQALEAGHEVTALVRSPEKLITSGDQLKVIQGNVTDAARVEEAVAGADAVISALGPTDNKPTFTVSRGTALIIDAMEKHGVRRLVVSAGAGVEVSQDDPQFINKVIGFLVRTFSKNVYEDMARTVEAVRNSNLAWTVVRVPMLTDDPAKGNVKVAYVGKGMGARITRADMAEFMLQQVEDDAYLQQAPAISN